MLKTFSEKDRIQAGKAVVFNFSIPVKDVKKGKYNIAFGFLFGVLPPSFNSVKNKIVLE